MKSFQELILSLISWLNCGKTLQTEDDDRSSSPLTALSLRYSTAHRATRAQSRILDHRFTSRGVYSLAEDSSIMDMEQLEQQDAEFQYLLEAEFSEQPSLSKKNTGMDRNTQPSLNSSMKRNFDDELEALLSIENEEAELMSDDQIRKLTSDFLEKERSKSLFLDNTMNTS